MISFHAPKEDILPARVQDVQPTTHRDQFCYSFTFWDQEGKIALTVGFATHEEAIQAAKQAKAMLENAVLVICSLIPSFRITRAIR